MNLLGFQLVEYDLNTWATLLGFIAIKIVLDIASDTSSALMDATTMSASAGAPSVKTYVVWHLEDRNHFLAEHDWSSYTFQPKCHSLVEDAIVTPTKQCGALDDDITGKEIRTAGTNSSLISCVSMWNKSLSSTDYDIGFPSMTHSFLYFPNRLHERRKPIHGNRVRPGQHPRFKQESNIKSITQILAVVDARRGVSVITWPSGEFT